MGCMHQKGKKNKKKTVAHFHVTSSFYDVPMCICLSAEKSH